MIKLGLREKLPASIPLTSLWGDMTGQRLAKLLDYTFFRLAMVNHHQKLKKIEERLCSTFFKEFNLRITAEAHQHVVNFLDVTFNLQQNTFQPYRKPGDTPVYINIQSNHPHPSWRKLPNPYNLNRFLPSLTSSRLLIMPSHSTRNHWRNLTSHTNAACRGKKNTHTQPSAYQKPT